MGLMRSADMTSEFVISFRSTTTLTTTSVTTVTVAPTTTTMRLIGSQWPPDADYAIARGWPLQLWPREPPSVASSDLARQTGPPIPSRRRACCCRYNHAHNDDDDIMTRTISFHLHINYPIILIGATRLYFCVCFCFAGFPSLEWSPFVVEPRQARVGETQTEAREAKLAVERTHKASKTFELCWPFILASQLGAQRSSPSRHSSETISSI